MSSQLKDNELLCKICIDDPDYPLEKNLQMLANRLCRDNFSFQSLSQARPDNPRTTRPTPDDTKIIGGEAYPLFPKVGVTQRMTAAAFDDFNKAEQRAEDALREEQKVERALIKDLMSYLSDKVLMAFNMIPGAKDALNTNDIYAVFPFLVRSWSGEGASKATIYLDRAVSAKQASNESHLAYSDRVKAIHRIFLLHFEDPDHPGFISSDVLLPHLYHCGLDPVRHFFILQTIFAQVDSIRDLPNCLELMNVVQTFVNNYA